MVIRIDETRNQSVINTTINGFYLTVMLKALAENVLIKKTQYGTGLDFDASQVNVLATLKREGKTYSLFNTNLGLLGGFHSHMGGGKNWQLGTDYVRPAVGAKHQNIRTLFIDLGGHLNLKGTDEVFIECTVGRNSFKEGVLDTSVCYVDIKPCTSIGKETGIYQLYTETIQAGTTTDSWNLGDNVTDVAVLNFEDSDETLQILQNIRISSNYWDQQFNLPDLITRNVRLFGRQPYNKGFNRADGVTIDSYVPASPQSFFVLNGEEIDGATLDISFDGSKVNASKNFVLYRKYETSLEIIERSLRMEQKHATEKLNSLPVTL